MDGEAKITYLNAQPHYESGLEYDYFKILRFVEFCDCDSSACELAEFNLSYGKKTFTNMFLPVEDYNFRGQSQLGIKNAYAILVADGGSTTCVSVKTGREILPLTTQSTASSLKISLVLAIFLTL